jgi:hypothetical protein
MTASHCWRLLNTFYRYEVDLVWVWRMGGPNHILQHVPSENPTQNPTTGPSPFWVMCCGNMTFSHCWRHLNTFYRYEVDLVWVWSGWEVPIISYSMSPVRTPPRRILRLAHPLFWSDGIVCCCGNMAASHGWRLLNTFYRYEVDLVWVWIGS